MLAIPSTCIPIVINRGYTGGLATVCREQMHNPVRVCIPLLTEFPPLRRALQAGGGGTLYVRRFSERASGERNVMFRGRAANCARSPLQPQPATASASLGASLRKFPPHDQTASISSARITKPSARQSTSQTNPLRRGKRQSLSK